MPTNPVKSNFTYTIKDFYKEYKKQEQGELVPYKVYRSVIEQFFCEIFRKMIYENFTFMMPYSLGSILIKASKTNLKNLKIDWNKTKQLGVIVRHLNPHTYGYYFSIVWDKSYVRFKNNAYYLFVATKSSKATRLGIGKKGLIAHIRSLSNDPNKKSFIKI